MADGVPDEPLHRHDLRADAAGQGRRPAARARRRSISPTPCTRASAIAAAARVWTARWCRSTRAQERPARRDHRDEAGRTLARLGESGARLRHEPSRAHQGPAMVQGAAAGGDAGARARDRRARARARRRDGGQPRRRRREGRVREVRRSLRGGRTRGAQHAADPDCDQGGRAAGGAPKAATPRPSRDAAAEQGRRRRQRHQRSRGRPADDGPRALLQTGAAGCDRRLRHPRQGRHDPPREAARTSRDSARASPSA